MKELRDARYNTWTHGDFDHKRVDPIWFLSNFDSDSPRHKLLIAGLEILPTL